MNNLTFKILPSEQSNDHQVRILIDNDDILRVIDSTAIGIDPVVFFSQKSLWPGGELLIGRCGCGCTGCGDETLTVQRKKENVIWLLHHSMLETDHSETFPPQFNVVSRQQQ